MFSKFWISSPLYNNNYVCSREQQFDQGNGPRSLMAHGFGLLGYANGSWCSNCRLVLKLHWLPHVRNAHTLLPVFSRNWTHGFRWNHSLLGKEWLWSNNISCESGNEWVHLRFFENFQAFFINGRNRSNPSKKSKYMIYPFLNLSTNFFK